MIAPKNYLSIPSLPATTETTIAWWEIRRLYYNLILLLEIVGISLVKNLPHWTKATGLGNSYVSEVGVTFLGGFLFLLIPANLWYLGGWIFEVILRGIWRRLPAAFGPVALSLGTLFSLAFVWFVLCQWE
jgi:hypothetical protein